MDCCFSAGDFYDSMFCSSFQVSLLLLLVVLWIDGVVVSKVFGGQVC